MSQLKWENEGFGFLIAPVLGGLVELVVYGADRGVAFWIQGAGRSRKKGEAVYPTVEEAQAAAYSAFEALMAEQGFTVMEGESEG